MEKKFTKGNWKIGVYTVEGVLISSHHPQNRDICTIWGYSTEYLEQQELKSNALLISKAPELLDFIEKHYRFLNLKDQEKALKLMKEATEL